MSTMSNFGIRFAAILLLIVTAMQPSAVFAVDYERNKEIAQDIYDIANYGEIRDRDSPNYFWKALGLILLGAIVITIFQYMFSGVQKQRVKVADLEVEVIRGKYLEVLSQSYVKRSIVLDELADDMGINKSAIVGLLKREGIYKSHEDDLDEETLKRLDQSLKDKIGERKLPDYILDEYKQVISSTETTRRNRIRQLAKELDRSRNYIITRLKASGCSNIPKN